MKKGLTPFGKAVLEKPENINEIKKQLSIACGKPMEIKLIDLQAGVQNTKPEENLVESFAKEADIEINIIEE